MYFFWNFYIGFLAIIKMTEGQFIILINITYNLKIKSDSYVHWTRQHVSYVAIFRWHERSCTVLEGELTYSMVPPFQGGVCNVLIFVLALVTFFPFIFSLLIDFCMESSKFSNQLFNLFFLDMWSILFWLLFVLFEIIYKIRSFLISSLNFFIC